MFVLPGLLALLIFIYARPFDFMPALRGVPFLYLFFGLAVFGYLVDLRQGKTDLRKTPHLNWVIAFVLWCFFTAGVKAPASLLTDGVRFGIAVVIYFLIAHGVRTFKAFELFMGTILACTLWISAVCVHMGLQPLECVAVSPGEDQNSSGRPDGRSCESPVICYQDPPDPEAMYRCEHAGLLGVTSIGGGRVRYVGVLQDPNEASMAVAIGVPLAFAFYQRRRNKKRLVLFFLTFVLGAMTVVYSGSRGGQIVFLATIGVYFLERYRLKGLILGVVCALPVLALGGRSGGEESSLERVENLYVGVQLFKQYPVLGVGFEQFTQYHHLTAHNSYVLAPAELGFFGMVAWLSVFWLTIKVPLTVTRTVTEPEGQVARVWAMALLSSMAGMAVGIFFLSFNYHYVLWIYIGVSGAFFAAVKRHKPDFKVTYGWKDFVGIAVGNTALLAFLLVYTARKLASG
ncbi:MAG: O-antigen ligase family protein [Polyangiaceae bacterium]